MNAAAEQHLARRRVWREKYAIRACYRGWFERMRPFIVPGPSVEIGAGAGDFKSFWPELVTTDVVPTPYIDFAADGMRLPLATASLSNIVVIDLLHHLPDPHRFFNEATRVLRPGGRILAIEPYITPLSFLVYRLLHHEAIWFGGYHRSLNKSDPWEGNLAMANLLFDREAAEWPRRHPRLRVLRRQRFSLLDFQLAGGFKPYTFVSRPRLYDFLLGLDRGLDWLAPLCGFRIFCVLELM